jgi:integrase
MAMYMKDYETITLKGSKVNFIKRNKKNNQKFIFDFTKNRKRYRQTYIAPKDTPTAMIRMAKIKCDAFYEQAGKIREDLDTNISVDTYWDRYREYKKNNWGQNHKRTLKGFYNNHIKKIIGLKQLRRVNTADIDDIMYHARSLSKRSQKTILEILNPLFTRAIKEGLIKETPVDQEIKRNATEEKKVVLGAEDKFKEVHKAINQQFADNPKLRAAFLFGFNGRRLNEVLTLQWSDIDLINMNYVIRAENSKVNSDMVFGLNSELKSILEELYKYKDSIWIFSSNRDSSIHMTKLSMHYNKIRQATGLKEFTFHWMRNLLVSALAGKDGVDVTDLSALLGHNDTGTLKKYLSLQREQSSRKAADAIGKMLV